MSDDVRRDGEDLTRAILARTSGDPCAAARDRLVGHADGALDDVDAELVAMHVAGCADCAALVGALRSLAADLPLLAEIEPDARFVADVLARTRPRPSLAARVRTRVVEAAAALLRRPRIAWEAAYVGTCVLAIAVGVPGSPLAGVPGRALDAARVNPVEEVAPQAAEVRTQVSRSVSSLWEGIAVEAVAAWNAVEAEVHTRSTLAGEGLRRLGTEWFGGASQQEQTEESKETER